MLNNAQLFRKIHKAGELYHEVFGSYPKKIGIYYPRWQQLDRYQEQFIEFPRLEITHLSNDLDSSPSNISVYQHWVDIEPIVGDGLEWDGVYLPHPYYPDKAMEVAKLEELAKGARKPCNS
jgi:hypothetical protein